MTDTEFLAEAERLASAATPGPGGGAYNIRCNMREAAFIAFARTALPRLVAMVRERDARIVGLMSGKAFRWELPTMDEKP